MTETNAIKTSGKTELRQTKTIRVAYTPDSDDAFNYNAWQHNRVTLNGYDATFDHGHIVALNRAAASGAYDVVAVSSAFYPTVADRYHILAVGNSVGRGYGPVLVSKRYTDPAELRGREIAVAGIVTTGGALAAMYCPGARFVEMQYDSIADAVAQGEVDAGVMIHEELLAFSDKGLHPVCDLGKKWCDDTTLPLPVGLNLVKKELGRTTARNIAETCRRSLDWARNHFDEAFTFASRFGRGCSRQHIEMFSNDDTAHMAPDVREALQVMFDRVATLRLAPRTPDYEVIDA